LVTDEPESDGPPSAAVEEKATTSYLSYLALGLSGTGSTTTTTDPPPASPSTIRATRQEPSRDFTPATTSRPGTPSTVGPNASGGGGGARTTGSHARAATTTGTGHSRSATGTGTPLPQQTHILLPPEPRRRKISPRLYFALFVDHLEQFVVFLETVAARRWGQTVDEEEGVKVATVVSAAVTITGSSSMGVVGQQQQQVLDEEEEVNELVERADQMAVWNTLLELYLTLPGGDNHPELKKKAQAGKQQRRRGGILQASVLRKKAINVLKSEVIPYDPTHALILCSGHGYTDGLVLLWERLGMYEDVIRFWMDKARRADGSDTVPDASDRVVEHLKRYGPSQPRLYLLVLRFLTSTPELLTKHQADVKEILEYVDKQGILTPVGMIQVLSRNNVASVGLVKDWLGARIKDAKDEIQNVRLRCVGGGAPNCFVC